MMKKLLLPIAAAIVLCVATPSFATYWDGHNGGHQGFDWSQTQPDREWNHDWPSRPEIKEWLSKKDWPKEWPKEWPKDGHHKWDGRCDNPVPEPATAGLSLMGLAALGAVTRRRRK